MANPTSLLDRIIREAGQHAGSRGSIGWASMKMKLRHLGRKLRNVVLANFAIFGGVAALGIFSGGIGILGVLGAVALSLAATMILLRYPKLRVPERADLNTSDVRQLVGRTELWLEAQRIALPPPAARLINGIGVQLDELQLQLREVDQKHPTALQIRKLVGEDLPEMIDGFRRIPERLRYEERSGSTPARQLEEGLGTICREIDSITRQLAEGSLDQLAIRTRYLEYKYGEGAQSPPQERGQV